MPSGGHARSGPPPTAGSRNSTRKGESWTKLPIQGRGGKKVPEFPLPSMTAFEETVWLMLWRKPQAVMWEQLGLEFQVAAYVRAFVESTSGDGSPGLKTAVLRMEDTLGLSVDGMARLRWELTIDEVGSRRTKDVSAEVTEPKSTRRLRAVNGA